MTFATDVTAIYAGRGAGKTTLARKLISAARLPIVVTIDPVARDGGVTTARELIEAIGRGEKSIMLRNAARAECLRCVYAVSLTSTRLRPIYLVCDEAPLYLDKATDALQKIMFQGRHRGLGMMILSQRPHAVSAALRSQATVTHYGRMTDHNDLRVAAQAIGPRRAATLSTARPGQFIRHPE